MHTYWTSIATCLLYIVNEILVLLVYTRNAINAGYWVLSENRKN